ncbi:protein APEM9 [Ziziphus jujuba]|uniref:Protein APEM9 n=2 Tax=Ziziphus jujuba TaxID=326968 RepID=A0A6P4A194_ZIZJJ|nr:protein APEM9 [Ziziphus jujuba]XP_024929420.1 protein APEM9 [Ziziphus jujuba]KAH7527813.1 hypothetical protein FEM48_Zijuj05G0006300 [Ziziphus jujuba var. spinosa]
MGIWEQIELSESYLVCSMFEEAASLASSILKRLCCDNKGTEEEVVQDEIELYDMLESTGMVLVQSLKELGRTSEILNELKKLVSSVATIPPQVLLIGSCFQISEGSSNGVQEVLEEFLNKWSLVDERNYVLVGAVGNVDYVEGCDGRFVLEVDKYLEVVEVYVMRLLVTTLNKMDLAISWIEKAELPEDRRQDILRRLHSLHSIKSSNLSKGSSSPLLADNPEAHSSNLKPLNAFDESPKVLKDNSSINGENIGKQAVIKLSKRMEPCIWWFRTITFKFGNARVVISNGKILLGCLTLLVYYILRRKKTSLKRFIQRQALSMKNGVVDLWQLAFSYQVNPLAAVQPPPSATRAGQR